MKRLILLVTLLLSSLVPPVVLAEPIPPQDVALHLEDVGTGFELAGEPEAFLLNGSVGPFWLYDIAFSRDYQIAEELGGPLFVGNRVVVAERNIPPEELEVFTQAVVMNLHMLEWEPTLAAGPQIGEGSRWLWAQREVDGVSIATYTVTFRTATALSMVQTVGPATASSMADAAALAQIVADRLAGLPTPAVPTGRFVSTEAGFSIEFPSGWEWLEGQAGIIVSALGPAGGENASFRPNCNVVVEPLTTPISIETYTEVASATLAQATLDFVAEESGTSQLGGMPAAVTVSAFTLPQLQGMRVRVVQYAALQNSQAYVVTCTASEDQFAANRSQFDAVAESFRFE